MKTRIQKWGHSLAVRIPKSFAEELGWSENAPVEMTLDDAGLVIKSDLDRAWSLDGLMAGVTGENIHPAWEAGGEAIEEGDGEGDR